MFIPTLRSQTTDEQKKLFLEPALRHEIIGCYAQTEVSFYLGLVELLVCCSNGMKYSHFVGFS